MSEEVRGKIDLITSTYIWGWACDSARLDEAVTVDVYVAGIRVGTVTADDYREDLEAANMGNGRHGFRFPGIAYLTPDTEQTIQICVSGAAKVIHSRTTADYVRDAHFLNSLRRLPIWRLYDIEVNPGDFAIRGVVAPSRDFRLSNIFFTANGEEFPEVEYPRPTPVLAEELWYMPGSGWLGFRCCFRRDTAELLRDRHVVLECRHRVSGERLRERDEYYIPANLTAALDQLPAPAQMARVQGMENPRMFLLGGYTTFRKLESVLRETLARDVEGFSRILDWGCGCGRLTRHLTACRGPRIVGADVDRENVAWCREHLAGADFERIPFTPPTQFEAESFDLIVGISVLTHLRQADHFLWLEELHRICRDGGLVVMSFQGDTSILWGNIDNLALNRWRSEGFSDTSRDAALDGLTDEEDYYRSSFHSKRYVLEHWSKHFEIIEIFEAFSANVQDLVIMRKRTAPEAAGGPRRRDGAWWPFTDKRSI